MVVWDLGVVIWRSLLLAVSLVNSQVDPRPYRGAPKAHKLDRVNPKRVRPSSSPETHGRESDPHSVCSVPTADHGAHQGMQGARQGEPETRPSTPPGTVEG